MRDLEPFTLAARQIEIDAQATAQYPALAARKQVRLAASPHAFLRGSAPLFYEILGQRPELAGGPATTGWIVGDMHLENVGAFRSDADEVVFGLNDFDDAGVGPLRVDLLRLAVSVLLAGRDFRASGRASLSLVDRLVRGYLEGVGGGAAPAMPHAVTALVSRAKDRHKKKLLDDRAPLDARGKRRFVRGERYLDLPPEVAPRAGAMLAAYVAALGDRAPAKAGTWKVEDAALRVAGNGSLGVLRVALLVRDDDDDERLVELKEARRASCQALLTSDVTFAHPGERVVGAARALLAAPPRHLAALEIDGRSFSGRRLFPQEDKLALDTMQPGAALDGLVHFIGHLVGAAHARGLAALGAPAPAPWTSAHVSALVDGAVVLAGIFEGIYLAWSRRAG